MRGHHHAGLGAVGVDRPQEPLGVEATEHHHGDARGEQPEARQRAGVVHRADDEVGAELGELVLGQRVDVLGDGLAAGEHRRGQLDALGPAGGARRVHEVGPGRDVGGRLRVGRRGQPRVPRRDALGGLAAPPDHQVEAGLAGRGQPDRRGLGPDEEHPGVGVGQDEGHLVGVRGGSSPAPSTPRPAARRGAPAPPRRRSRRTPPHGGPRRGRVRRARWRPGSNRRSTSAHDRATRSSRRATSSGRSLASLAATSAIAPNLTMHQPGREGAGPQEGGRPRSE